eukprot:jgi/Chrzof1/12697/Cz07g04120.t1
MSSAGPTLIEAARQQPERTRLELTQDNVNQAVEEFLAEVDNAYNLRDVFKIAAPTQQLDNDTAAATATAGDTTRGTSSSSAVGDMVAAFMSQVANSSQNALNDTTADAVMGRRLTEAGWDSAVDSVEFAATESELSGWSEPNGASEHVHEVEFSMAQLQALVDDQESDSEIDDLVADEDGISVSADAASANIFASNPTARRRLQQAGVGSGVSMLFSSLVAPAFSGGTSFLTPLLGGAGSTLLGSDVLGTLLSTLTAPFTSFLGANKFPLPQNKEQLKANLKTLLTRWTNQVCTNQSSTSSQMILGSYVKPTLTIELKPVSCPVVANDITGRNEFDFDGCDAAVLSITTTPTVVTGPYQSAATVTGAECKYQNVFGVDVDKIIGGGASTFTLKKTVQGMTINPVSSLTSLLEDAGGAVTAVTDIIDLFDDDSPSPSPTPSPSPSPDPPAASDQVASTTVTVTDGDGETEAGSAAGK